MPGLHGVRGDDDPLGQMSQVLDEAGYTSVVATNCDQTYHRYLKLGEQLSVRARLLDVAGPKRTALGEGWFVTTRSTWFSSGEPVATMDFRILKFRPTSPSDNTPPSAPTTSLPQRRAPDDMVATTTSLPEPVMRPQVTPDTAFFWDGHRGRRAAHPALRGLRRAAPPARPHVPGLRRAGRRRVRRRGRDRRGVQLRRPPPPAGTGQEAAAGRRAGPAARGRPDGRRDAGRRPGSGAHRAAGPRHVRPAGWRAPRRPDPARLAAGRGNAPGPGHRRDAHLRDLLGAGHPRLPGRAPRPGPGRGARRPRTSSSTS